MKTSQTQRKQSRKGVSASLVAWLMTATALLTGVTVSYAGLVEDALKIGGVTLVVSKFGGKFNDGLNKIIGVRNDDPAYTTKVVVILSGGQGKSIGACQVAGAKAAVDKVQAVAQVETKVLGIRLRALIPIATKSITNIRRVEGVGVSGLVDIKI